MFKVNEKKLSHSYLGEWFRRLSFVTLVVSIVNSITISSIIFIGYAIDIPRNESRGLNNVAVFKGWSD